MESLERSMIFDSAEILTSNFFFEKPDLRNISAGRFLKIWDEY